MYPKNKLLGSFLDHLEETLNITMHIPRYDLKSLGWS